MNKWPIALGSLTAAVVGVIAVLAVAGVFDSDSDVGPFDGEQADSAALCIEGAEDCEDTIVIPGDDDEDVSDAPPPDDGDLPISDETDDTAEGEALAIEAAFAALEALDGPPASEFGDIDVRAVDWPNACLGVETPGIACAQVITPGYIVFLDNGLLAFEFPPSSPTPPSSHPRPALARPVLARPVLSLAHAEATHRHE